MKDLSGFYAVEKEDKNKTLFSFEWSSSGDLLILQGITRVKVDKNDYEIVNMKQVTVDDYEIVQNG